MSNKQFDRGNKIISTSCCIPYRRMEVSTSQSMSINLYDFSMYYVIYDNKIPKIFCQLFYQNGAEITQQPTKQTIQL